jgi:tetratricopeptide (TPR) repeat protein
MKVRSFYKILFLLLVVLTIYFPAISGEVNTVDDVHIINAYGINGHRTLKDIFLPASQFYFRPIIELTYFADNLLWGLDASFMHLENIVFHAVNVLLVFCVATRVSAMAGGVPALPLLSSLLFALHPVNTESVSWIAGRTDPLAASFILGAILLLLTGIQSARATSVIASVALMLLSFFVKETSLMLLPVSLMMVASLQPKTSTTACKQSDFGKRIIWTYASVLALFTAFAAVRLFWKPAGSDNAFSMVILKGYDLLEMLVMATKAMGFYLRKLLMPYPLNFAIDSLSDGYLLLGAVVPLLCIYLVYRRELVTSFILAGVLFIVPAAVVAAAGINWTLVAERYLYIPTAFFSIGLSGILLRSVAQMKAERWVYPCLGLLAIPLAWTTFERNLLWRDNLALYGDTVKKSPGFGDIHNELGLALLKKGDREAAAQHFALAEQLSKRPKIREFARMNLLNVALQGKTPYERRDLIRSYMEEHEEVSPDLVKMLRNTIQEILYTEKERDRRAQLMQEMIGLNNRLYRDLHDPLCLYNNGQMMLALGNREAALQFLRQTVTMASPGVYYLASARKLLERLENH